MEAIEENRYQGILDFLKAYVEKATSREKTIMLVAMHFNYIRRTAYEYLDMLETGKYIEFKNKDGELVIKSKVIE